MTVIEWISDNVYESCTEDLALFCRRRSIVVPPSLASHPLVFVRHAALRQVKEHLEADVSREHGGILVGMPYRDVTTGLEFVDVHAAIPAPRTVGTGTHLQFTPDAWEHVSARIDREFPGRVVVGWYHSHPGLGVFMSETDQASQRAFYNHRWSVALVVDPVCDTEGWFVGPTCVRFQPLAYEAIDEAVPPHETIGNEPDEAAGGTWRQLQLPLGFLSLVGAIGLCGWLWLRWSRRLPHFCSAGRASMIW